MSSSWDRLLFAFHIAILAANNLRSIVILSNAAHSLGTLELLYCRKIPEALDFLFNKTTKPQAPSDTRIPWQRFVTRCPKDITERNQESAGAETS